MILFSARASFIRHCGIANLRRRLSSSDAPSVKHVVMVRLMDSITDSQIQSIQRDLLELPRQIPEIQTHELGVDLLLEAGQKHPAGPNRQFCWSVTFASVEDYQTYDTSEAHLSFVGKLREVMEPGSRAAIQYKCKTPKD